MATKNIDPNLRLIGDYCKLEKNDMFQIPEYQRAYSWQFYQCDKLWQDIMDYMDSGAEDPYFFGTVIVDCSTPNKLNLIDGQQRTTTFLLLLKALQLHLSDAIDNMDVTADTKALYKGLTNSYDKLFEIIYKADEEKQEEIKADWKKAKGIMILENRSVNELVNFKSDFQKIMEAETSDEAERSVYKIPRKKLDNKYTNYFRNFDYFCGKISELSESQLNQFAKTILTKCQIIEIKSWQIEQAITMFNSLNSTGMPLSDADIISAQLYSNSKDEDTFKQDWEYIKDLSNELCERNVVSIEGMLQQFMYINRTREKEYKVGEVTVPGVRKYYTVEHSKLLKKPVELCAEFTKILAIWHKIKDYPVVKLLLKFNENFKLFFISYLMRFDVKDITKAKVLPMAECLLRIFAMLELSGRGYSSKEFKTFLFNENLKLVDPSYTNAKIEADFDKHINDNWDESEIVDLAMQYDKNILVFLHEYLYAKENNLKFDFNDKVNVEHIMPASGHNLDVIRQDAGIADIDEFDEYANMLGNKILLEEDINKSISNDWFKTKKGSKVSDKKGYIGSSYGMAQKMAAYPKNVWKKGDIKKQTEEVAKRLAKFILGV
ncbi:MAG: DUF262 domain-containing HNH endonuclease family protein [Bacteroidales bacterium]|nr:DUF262 domain-containing HNH endonuclease family protein [Bacteroidales bacterium]